MDRFWFSISGFTTTTLIMICIVPFLLAFTIVFLTIVFCCLRNREAFLLAHTESSPSAVPSTSRFSLRNPFRRSRNQAFRSRCANSSNFRNQRGLLHQQVLFQSNRRSHFIEVGISIWKIKYHYEYRKKNNL